MIKFDDLNLKIPVVLDSVFIIYEQFKLHAQLS